MSVIAIGVSHRRSDLALLERLSIPADEHRKVLHELVEHDHVLEAALLSTCNRVELYVHVSRFHPGLDEVTGWLSHRAGDLRADFLEQSFVAFDESAAQHLFRVAAGIDSMVVGERQIALQVKDALEEARHEGTARRMLQRLFRQAISVGKRVRRETDISSGASSMVDVGLDCVAEHTGSLAGTRALIIGAGKIGSLSASRLVADGAALRIFNRSDDKAQRLAAKVGGAVAGSLAEGLAWADIAICTTGAAQPVVTAELLSAVRGGDGRRLVLLDLAMPRNVAPACADLADIAIVDIADVRDLAHRRAAGRLVGAAQAIVDDEAARYSAWLSAIEVEPTIRALRSRAETVRRSELDRLAKRLASLTDEQREAVDVLTSGIVNTLLHGPTVRLKELADAGGADIAVDALRDLFELETEPDDDSAG